MFGVVQNSTRRTHRAQELLERVGLAGRSRHLPAEMSGGEKLRLTIARSLANAPDIILATLSASWAADAVSAASAKEFDSSYKRNEATEFPLNGVIKCWTEACSA